MKCASAKVSERAAKGAPEPEPILSNNKEDATRFFTQSARGDDLPSAPLASLRAMDRLFGQDAGRRAPEEGSAYSGEQKWAIARTLCAEVLARAGGHVGVVKSLKSVGRGWTHCSLGARVVIMRCVACARKTARRIALEAVRHLPKLLRSGDRVGIDLKTVATKDVPGANR